METPRKRWLALLATLIAIGLFAASCGSDGNADGGGDTDTTDTAGGDETTDTTEAAVEDDTETTESAESGDEFAISEEAQALVDAAKAGQYSPHGEELGYVWSPPESSPPPAEGKLVIDIPCTQAAVGCSRPGDAFLEAAEALGWETQLIDPAGDPAAMQAALRQALQLEADGVYMAGASVEQIGADLLKEMRDAGVVMMLHGGDNQPLGPEGWSGIVNNDYGQTSPALAAWVAADSGGQAKVLVVNNSEFPEVDNGAIVFEQQIGELCPTCEVVSTMDYSIVDIATTMPERLKAELQANPEIDYVYSPYDFASTIMAPAIDQLGLTGQVKLIGADGNPQNLQNIADGLQAASFARPYEMMGYIVADQMNRVFNGEDVITDPRGFQTESYPMQLIDSTNLPDDVTTPYNGGFDYRALYKELWGVE